VEENTLNKLTETYIKIRSKRTDLSSEFKKKDDGLKEQQDKIKAALLEYLKDNDINSVGTDAGMFYRSQKRRYWTSDWESMHKFILEHEAPEFLEKRLNQTAVKEFLEENPELLPPGLNVQSEYTLSIRKNK
jgi:kynurenine formamidase